MIQRLESQSPWWPRLAEQERPAPTRERGRHAAWGWILIAGLTGLALAWVLYRWIGQPAWFATLGPGMQQSIALLETAGLATLSLVWAGLWWSARRDEATRERPSLPVLTLPDLLALDPAAFERYAGALFSRKGYRVRRRGGSGDLGVDLELTDRLGRQAIVQCKRYQHTVGADVVRELYGTLVHERVNHAFLVTTADISASAREWAAGKPLTLIDGVTLLDIAAQLRQGKDGRA